MLDDLEPVVRTALMRILSAVYETSLVQEVDINLVLQLFGAPPFEHEMMISLDDPEFLDEYAKARAAEKAKFSDEIPHPPSNTVH